jgi:hypothetical protein
LGAHIDELTKSISDMKRAVSEANASLGAEHDAYKATRAVNIRTGQIERLGDAGIAEQGLPKSAVPAEISAAFQRGHEIVGNYNQGVRSGTAFTRRDIEMLDRMADIIRGLILNPNTGQGDASRLDELERKFEQIQSQITAGFQH